jgi:hypothetical protein
MLRVVLGADVEFHRRKPFQDAFERDRIAIVVVDGPRHMLNSEDRDIVSWTSLEAIGHSCGFYFDVDVDVVLQSVSWYSESPKLPTQVVRIASAPPPPTTRIPKRGLWGMETMPHESLYPPTPKLAIWTGPLHRSLSCLRLAFVASARARPPGLAR